MKALYAGALLVLMSSAAFVEGELFRLKRGGAQCVEAQNRARDACPESNYPKLTALGRVREDDARQLLRSNPISDYCSELTSGLSCSLNAIKSFPKECLSLQETAMFDVMIPMYEKVQDLVVDICTNDVQVIQSNIGCLTAPQRQSDAETCMRAAYQASRGPGSSECDAMLEAFFCIAAKVEEDSSCQAELAAVLYKVAFKVYEIAEPMCQGPNGHFMEKAQEMLKFF